jgi:hypothetical protein
MKENKMVFAYLPAGSVEYGQTEAAVEIDELIAALEEAREDGATHVVGLSGNRGDQYVRLVLVQGRQGRQAERRTDR